MDGVGVIPTDTQHAFVTSMSSKHGTRRIYELKGVALDRRKPLSLLCSDLSMASQYCDMTAVPRRWFQAMKSCLPGPYTFILRASAAVPRVLLEHKSHAKVWKRREVGIRVPKNSIATASAAFRLLNRSKKRSGAWSKTWTSLCSPLRLPRQLSRSTEMCARTYCTYT